MAFIVERGKRREIPFPKETEKGSLRPEYTWTRRSA